MNGTAEAVALLIEHGADVNAADSTGLTPLIAAAGVDNAAVAKLLIAKGAAANAKANIPQSATPLMGAAFNGNAELTRLLLARNVDIDAVSADRGAIVKNGPVLFGHVTALQMATSNGSAEVVKLLLDAGAAVDTPDMRGMTALMWSVSTDHPEPRVVRLLLDKGADASARSARRKHTGLGAEIQQPLGAGGAELKAVSIAAALPRPTAGSQPTTPREAVERSMPLLREASARGADRRRVRRVSRATTDGDGGRPRQRSRLACRAR